MPCSQFFLNPLCHPFFLLAITPCKTRQPLQGMALQEKEEKGEKQRSKVPNNSRLKVI